MTKSVQTKREREKKVVQEMIHIYCRSVHKHRGGLCPECQTLLDYAHHRSDVCPFMENKTFCSQCKVHCYSPQNREQIRRVMRFSGPRMLLHHPVLAVLHLIEERKDRSHDE